MVYLPTFGWFFTANVVKYTIHGSYGVFQPSMFRCYLSFREGMSGTRVPSNQLRQKKLSTDWGKTKWLRQQSIKTTKPLEHVSPWYSNHPSFWGRSPKDLKFWGRSWKTPKVQFQVFQKKHGILAMSWKLVDLSYKNVDFLVMVHDLICSLGQKKRPIYTQKKHAKSCQIPPSHWRAPYFQPVHKYMYIYM